MQNFFDQLMALTQAQRLGAVVGLIALLLGGYWYYFYDDLQQEQAHLVQEQQKLEGEREDYRRRKREYLAYRNEVNGLLEEQKDLLRVLPKRDDIEQFIESVQAQVELAGLTKVSSVRESAQPVEMYLKIPVRMSVTGTYHQINHFFKQVGDLKRIVNIENLSLSPAPSVQATPQNLLRADFLASTFQFVDSGGGKKKGGTSITVGGGQ